MKYIYPLFVMLAFFTTSAQEAQHFENTWHLHTIQKDDSAPLYDVSEMDPSIAPYLDILENLKF